MRGFVNSWAIAIIALSFVVLFSTLYTLNFDFSAVDAGYAAELARWIGDFDEVSAQAGDCAKNTLSTQLEGAARVTLSDRGRDRSVNYHSNLIDFEVTLERNYRPFLNFKFPSDSNPNIDCVHHTVVTFSWYRCDPDSDTVITSLYQGGTFLGNTTGTTLDVGCAELQNGSTIFTIIGSDGTISYSDSVGSYVYKPKPDTNDTNKSD